MSEKTTPDAELLASFAEEAKRRCDVIAAGLATETNDFETMRMEAHALKGAAGVLGLRRLAELAGLMESDLADAKKSGTIRGGRTHHPDLRLHGVGPDLHGPRRRLLDHRGQHRSVGRWRRPR